MNDTHLLVRHIGGETSYDTTIFVTEDNTAVLLVYADSAKQVLLAAYNAGGWISADIIEPDKEVKSDVPETICAEAERVL